MTMTGPTRNNRITKPSGAICSAELQRFKIEGNVEFTGVNRNEVKEMRRRHYRRRRILNTVALGR